ncbi:MAG: hypothetical protein RL201_732, partial [Actinomycetota bacterium]
LNLLLRLSAERTFEQVAGFTDTSHGIRIVLSVKFCGLNQAWACSPIDELSGEYGGSEVFISLTPGTNKTAPQINK